MIEYVQVPWPLWLGYCAAVAVAAHVTGRRLGRWLAG